MKRDPHTQILEELARASDELMLDWVRNGKPAVNDYGQPLLDDDGNPRRRPLSAAELTAVIKRLHDCKITVVVQPGSTLDQVREELQGEEGYRFPSLPPIAGADEDDAATAAG